MSDEMQLKCLNLCLPNNELPLTPSFLRVTDQFLYAIAIHISKIKRKKYDAKALSEGLSSPLSLGSEWDFVTERFGMAMHTGRSFNSGRFRHVHGAQGVLYPSIIEWDDEGKKNIEKIFGTSNVDYVALGRGIMFLYQEIVELSFDSYANDPRIKKTTNLKNIHLFRAIKWDSDLAALSRAISLELFLIRKGDRTLYLSTLPATRYR
jgi:hypothetical protein